MSVADHSDEGSVLDREDSVIGKTVPARMRRVWWPARGNMSMT